MLIYIKTFSFLWATKLLLRKISKKKQAQVKRVYLIFKILSHSGGKSFTSGPTMWLSMNERDYVKVVLNF